MEKKENILKDLGKRGQIEVKKIQDGVKKTMDWYRENKGVVDKRYNVFVGTSCK